jgi:hypothetical protein
MHLFFQFAVHFYYQREVLAFLVCISLLNQVTSGCALQLSCNLSQIFFPDRNLRADGIDIQFFSPTLTSQYGPQQRFALNKVTEKAGHTQGMNLHIQTVCVWGGVWSNFC